MSSEPLPKPEVVRERIASIPREDIRLAMMAEYMFAGRISEVVGHSSPKDTSKARGPSGKDVTLQWYRVSARKKEQAVVFEVKTAKRQGKIRNVALPVKYEPWALPLYDYFKRFEGLVFPFTRQSLGTLLGPKNFHTFAGLTYRIEGYNVWTDGKVEKVVSAHDRPFAPHAVRHVRPTELVEKYGFDGIDLASYGGWTMKSAVGIGSLDRYLSLGWQRYFPKLLIA